MTLIVLLGCVVLFAAWAQCLDVNDLWNKVTWTGALLGAAIGVVVADWNVWAGLLIAMVFLSQSMAVWVVGGPVEMTVPTVTGTPRVLKNVMLMSGPMPSDVYRRTLIGAAVFAGAYAALAPQMQIGMVRPLLWVLASVGVGTGAWALYSWRKGRTYHEEWGRGLWVMHGHYLPNKYIDAGQNMPNHAESVAMVGLAALAGLAWMGDPWVLLLALFPLATLLLCGGVKVTQGLLHGAVLAAAMLLVWNWRIGAVAVAACPLAVLGIGWWHAGGRADFDSFRLWLWRESLVRWWRLGWTARVLGLGTGRYTEFLVGANHPGANNATFTSAHNEYVQQTVEHGVVGLVVMVAYLVDALWRTGTGLPEQQAVFLMGATLCSVALVNFPWTLMHELPVLSRPNGPPEHIGSPALIAMSLVVALLAEVR